MRVGLLLIGDELLTGKIRDRNGYLVAQHCFNKGLVLEEVRIVPDEISAISKAIHDLANNSDLVITSGGIGPTHDDKTFAAIARAFDLPMELHAPTKEKLEGYLLGRGQALNAARLKMVTFPKSALVEEIEGLWLPLVSVGKVFALPGVPDLFAALLVPVLDKLKGQPKRLVSLGTQTPEGDLAETLERAIEKWPDVAIGSYPQPKGAKFKVKITVEGTHAASVQNSFAWLKAKLNGKEL